MKYDTSYYRNQECLYIINQNVILFTLIFFFHFSFSASMHRYIFMIYMYVLYMQGIGKKCHFQFQFKKEVLSFYAIKINQRFRKAKTYVAAVTAISSESLFHYMLSDSMIYKQCISIFKDV